MSDATGDELNPIVALDDGTEIPLDRLEEIIHKRVEFLMDTLGRQSYKRRG